MKNRINLILLISVIIVLLLAACGKREAEVVTDESVSAESISIEDNSSKSESAESESSEESAETEENIKFPTGEGVGEVPEGEGLEYENEAGETESTGENEVTTDSTPVKPEATNKPIESTKPVENTEPVETSKPSTSSTPSVSPNPTATPSEGETEYCCEYDAYLAMSAADQETYMNSFSSVMEFIAWSKTALNEHEEHKEKIEVEGGDLNIGDFIRK